MHSVPFHLMGEEFASRSYQLLDFVDWNDFAIQYVYLLQSFASSLAALRYTQCQGEIDEPMVKSFESRHIQLPHCGKSRKEPSPAVWARQEIVAVGHKVPNAASNTGPGDRIHAFECA